MLRKIKYCIFLIYGLGHLENCARADDVLYLELVINGKNTAQIVEATHKKDDWEIATKELTNLGINLNNVNDERILLSSIPHTQVIYDAQLQRLLINLPSSLLPMQYFGANIPSANRSQPRRDNGVFVNYNIVSIFGNTDSKMMSLWHELHFFNDNFFVISNGIWQDKSSVLSSSGYTRFDTYWQHDFENSLHVLTLGDVINATPNWGRSIRMGGIRIARDYELNPNLITYPLPQFYGESALPGSVDLIINNQLSWRDQVTSGPFLINMVPYLSGAGVAQVVTTNAQGQQIRQAVNFYVTNDLLAPKMIDYDFTAGFRRENFGLESNQYDNSPLVSASLRYGLNRFLTPQLLIQAGDGLKMGGVGLSFLAGSGGVFDIAVARSRYDKDSFHEQGHQTSLAYTYTYERFGVNASYLRQNGNYRDLGSQTNRLISTREADTQAQVSLSLHDNQLGSFNLGYFRIENKQEKNRSLINFSWSRYYAHDITSFINISRNLFDKREHSFSFTLSIPFGSRGQASESIRRDSDGQQYSQLQLLSNAPYKGGLGWGFSVDDSPQKNRYLTGDWRSQYAEFSLSAAQSRQQEQYSAALSGALVVMDGDTYATRLVSDAFALVETDRPDVPVLIGHQLVGKTNINGKLLVPDLDSYLENRLAIDPMFLPANALVESVEQLVTPRRKGGVHVKFPVSVTQSALAKLVTRDQQPIPAGAILADKNSDKNFTVGWDGDLYIENLTEPLTLFWADDECLLEIIPPTDKTLVLPRIGPFVCLPISEVAP